MQDWIQTLPPDKAWEPLSSGDWDLPARRHLLSRLAYGSTPALLRFCEGKSPAEVIDLLLAIPDSFPLPEAIRALEGLEVRRRFLQTRDQATRRQMIREFNRQNREAYVAYAAQWLTHAREERFSAREKLVEFLQNVWVVNFTAVRDAEFLFLHQDLLRRRLHLPYPELCKAASRSPAIIRFLNLNQNRKGQPNENFARELFELFTLGEGQYSESDVKEAARAFTGYSAPAAVFRFRPRIHDSGRKTLFGQSGRFAGDEVIDLVFRQPAAQRFLPAQFCRAYLAEDPLPAPYLEVLGSLWKNSGYRVDRLARIVCSSRIFYHPAFRSNAIKSPNHFLLGSLQTLGLAVNPLARHTLLPLRSMGQPFFNPPNVRGWVGGKSWINSSTLKARREWTASLFDDIDFEALNADEYVQLMAAAAEEERPFTIDETILERLAAFDADTLVTLLLDRTYPGEPPPAIVSQCHRILGGPSGSTKERIAQLLQSLLQGPQFHLC